MKELHQKALSSLRIIRRTNDLLLQKKGTRKLFFTAFLLSCLVTQAWALDAWLFGQLTNKLTNQPSVFASVSLLVAVAIGFAMDIVPRSLRYWVKSLELKFRRITTDETQNLYWKSYVKFDLQDKENSIIQNALNNASRNQGVVQEVFFMQWTLGISVLTVIVCAFVLSSIAWWYFFVIILMVLPRVYFTRKRKVRTYTQEKQLNEINRYRDMLASYIGSKESSLNNSRGHYLGLFDSIRRKITFFTYNGQKHFTAIGYWGDIWFYLLLAVILYSLTLSIAAGTATIGTLFLLFGSIRNMYTELDQATTILVDLDIAAKKAEDFFLIVDSVPAITDAVKCEEVDDTIAPRIEFEDVYFRYPESENYILEGVSFTIESGETVGLIAKNGEGKTTIGLLLLRFYDPEKGSIRINGVDLRLIRRGSLLAITGALFQDFVTLKTTIKSAILATRPGEPCSDFQIWNFLEQVGLKEYAEKLPHKLNQKVDRIFKDSVKLSGGQNQKLGLAGIIHRNPKLVLLDEFTSALDPEAEKEIVEQYQKILQNKTGIIISHRYLSLKIVDRIIVLQKGKVVECGKKSELLIIEGGVFKKLYTAAQFATSPN